jgi:hypothetical protein
LEEFYFATSGPNWTCRDYWLTDAPLYRWEGIEVDGAGEVESIRLPKNNLAGEIPHSLFELKKLLLLNLACNRLGSTARRVPCMLWLQELTSCATTTRALTHVDLRENDYDVAVDEDVQECKKQGVKLLLKGEYAY